MTARPLIVGGLFALAFLLFDPASQTAEAHGRWRQRCCHGGYAPVSNGYGGCDSYGYGGGYGSYGVGYGSYGAGYGGYGAGYGGYNRAYSGYGRGYGPGYSGRGFYGGRHGGWGY